MRHRKCFSAFLLSLATASALGQNTIHVPADASTIQAAIDAARNGDTILVAPGTYNENLNFKGKAITVTSGAKSYADAASTIIYAAKDGPAVTFNSNEPAAAVLNGFNIQNGHANAASGLADGGILISQSSPTITNNIVSSNFGCGIGISNNASPLIQGNDITLTRTETEKSPKPCGNGNGIAIVNAGNVQLIGNTIENNILDASWTDSNPCGAGITIFAGADVLLKNNTIRNNQAQCSPGIDAAGQAPSHLSLIQNLLYGNTGSAVGGDLQIVISGNLDPPYPSLTEINNTIYGLGQELVLTFGPSNIANNIFMNVVTDPQLNSWGALSCADPQATGSPLNLSHNDIYNVLGPISSGCNLGEGNLSIDAQFLDPANGDFHTPPASPVVAAGDIDAPAIPAADLDSKARTVCKTIDMGVYEARPHPPITLATSQTPAPGGSALVFTAQLTGNCNMPTGTVTFFDGSIPMGTAQINSSGTAVLNTALLVVGKHNITATYPGDFNFEGSTSNVVVQIITGDPTTTTLTISPNPANALSPISMSSVVTSPYGTPTGSVTFTAGTTSLATAPLDGNGKVSATISTLGAGTYSISAIYTADTRFQSSSSAPVQEKVIGIDTVTTLSSSLNPAAAGQAIAFTVTVKSAQGRAVPTGAVTLMDATASLATAPLNDSGIAVFNIATLVFGSHALTARYAGSANFEPSSAALTQAVTLIPTELTFTASPNPANAGQLVTLTATVISNIPGMTVSGVVTFRDGLTMLGAVSLNTASIATFQTSTLAIGTHPLQATLSAGSVFGGSTSTIVDEVIQAYDFTLSTPQSSLTLPSGDWTVTSVTVTPIGGFHGSVSLVCSEAPDHTQCLFPDSNTVSLANGTATVLLEVNTSDVLGYGRKISRSTAPPNFGYRRDQLFTAILLPVFSFLGFRRRGRRALRSLLALGAIAALIGMQACSGKLPAKTAPGTYNLTIAGTSKDVTSLQHSVPLRLIVTR